jgi:hypothetical protein
LKEGEKLNFKIYIIVLLYMILAACAKEIPEGSDADVSGAGEEQNCEVTDTF